MKLPHSERNGLDWMRRGGGCVGFACLGFGGCEQGMRVCEREFVQAVVTKLLEWLLQDRVTTGQAWINLTPCIEQDCELNVMMSFGQPFQRLVVSFTLLQWGFAGHCAGCTLEALVWS